MSKKNSSVILKSGFKDYSDLSKIFENFCDKIENLKKKKFVVALSGGPDSLALVALCKAYSYKKKTKFEFVLVNHNIRKNSTKEALQVKKLLKKYQINLKIIDNKIKINRNIQSQARQIRYDLIKKYCNKKSIKIILTAHNLEDQVETFFIRLSRGSGLTGLSSMRTLTKIGNNINLYRPLLDTKKKYLIKLSKIMFNKFFKDPSNKDQKFLRIKIRNLEKPLKKSGIHYEQIIKSINNLASSKATLDQYFEKIFKETTIISYKKVSIDLKKFKSLNKEIKMNIINLSIKYLKNNYYNPRSKKVINLISNIESNKFENSTLGGCLFTRNKDTLVLKSVK